MASTGDAPPPPPQPEEITPEVLHRLATSSITTDNLLALSTLRGEPVLYAEITPDLSGLFTRSLLSNDVALRSMARGTFFALARHVGRIGDVLTTNSLFAPLTRYIISCEDLPSERPDDGSTLIMLNELAPVLPQALVPHLTAIIALCNKTVTSLDNDPTTRHKSLDLLECLSENLPESIPDKSLPEIVDSCLAAMSNIDWGQRGTNDWFEGTERNQIEEASWGKDCLVEIVTNLHERSIVQVTIDQTCEYLQSEDWECRLAGVRGLKIIGTTGRIVLMDQIVMTLAHVLSDPDARIRGAACHVLSLVAHNIGPNPSYLDDIVPLLIESMADSVRRVANKAAEAFIEFIENCPVAISANLDALITAIVKNLGDVAYMRDFSEWREKLIDNQLSMVKTLASASIQEGSPAESLMEKLGIKRPHTPLRLSIDQFTGVYDRLMIPLKWMLPNKLVASQALECISRLAIAVGMAKFAGDTQYVLISVITRLAFMRPDDCASALTSLRGIFMVMGSEIVPSLPLIMSPLLLVARYKDHWGLGREDCGQNAMRILEDFAKGHKEALLPYVPEVMGAICANTKSASFRVVTMDFALILDCVKHEGVPAMRALWVQYLTALKGLVAREDKKPFVQPYFYSYVLHVHKAVQMLGDEGLSTEDVDDVAWMIKDALEKKSEKDHESIVKAIRAFEYALCILMMRLLKMAGVKSHNAIHSLMPHILSSMNNVEYQLRIITSYVHFAPQMALAHIDRIYGLVLTSICDDRPVMRSEGFYTLTFIANLESPEWSPLIVKSIPAIIAALSRADARLDEDCTKATTRTIVAVARIIDRHGEIDLTPLLSSYVEWLLDNEVTGDDGKWAYDALAELVQKKHPLIVGENNEKWPKLIRIMSRALTKGELGTSSYGGTVRDRLENALKEMKAGDEQLFHDSMARAGLTAEETAIVTKILS